MNKGEMVADSPLAAMHEVWAEAELQRRSEKQVEGAELEWVPWGPSGDPSDVAGREGEAGTRCVIPGRFGDVEPEYAALRRGAGLIDRGNHAVIEVGGADRVDLVDRIVTQKCAAMKAGDVRESFLTGRKGRIEADLLIVETGDQLLIDVDHHAAASVREAIERVIFTEDVTVDSADRAVSSWTRIGVHGAIAPDVLRALTKPIDVGVDPGRSVRIMVHPPAGDGHAPGPFHVVIARRDLIGDPGLEFFVAREHATKLWQRLLDLDASDFGGKRTVRPVGWYAFNMARIEAGSPLFQVDFGTDSLPHETGMLARRVSFTKGCYPGQEIVARMENLGRPKRVVTGLVIEGDGLPIAGAQVFLPANDESGGADADGGIGALVGAVTSSTMSPMNGFSPIAIATMKTTEANQDQTVLVSAEGELRVARVNAPVAWCGDGEVQTWRPGERAPHAPKEVANGEESGK